MMRAVDFDVSADESELRRVVFVPADEAEDIW